MVLTFLSPSAAPVPYKAIAVARLVYWSGCISGVLSADHLGADEIPLSVWEKTHCRIDKPPTKVPWDTRDLSWDFYNDIPARESPMTIVKYKTPPLPSWESVLHFHGVSEVLFCKDVVSGQLWRNVSSKSGVRAVLPGQPDAAVVVMAPKPGPPTKEMYPSAKEFNEGIKKENVLASDYWFSPVNYPKFLLFNLFFPTMTFILNGQQYVCEEMRIGLGTDGNMEDNWWIGSRFCVLQDATEIWSLPRLNCECGLTFVSHIQPGLNHFKVWVTGTDEPESDNEMHFPENHPFHWNYPTVTLVPIDLKNPSDFFDKPLNYYSTKYQEREAERVRWQKAAELLEEELPELREERLADERAERAEREARGEIESTRVENQEEGGPEILDNDRLSSGDASFGEDALSGGSLASDGGGDLYVKEDVAHDELQFCATQLALLAFSFASLTSFLIWVKSTHQVVGTPESMVILV
eukprot:gnl/MRDRNA2_/MRDRNA2_62169_c0_seq1.p1 gnl/MRDRNA2_/MRDRNA2_62169_c0~~gnl/MRDRNA2_/MRDRNA2_62169_c0_seq1.p1  ORF type:complete len:466 (+),score=77.10 gnl/MRDRNA2_/MRDRNA2_62169_c0_seq1:90-1487(+)